MRISDWSSDVCSSDLVGATEVHLPPRTRRASPVGAHPRADARLYGPRLPRREAVRLVERADRRDADPLDRRRQPRATGAGCREPHIPAILPRTARREGLDRKNVWEGNSVVDRGKSGGPRSIKKK